MSCRADCRVCVMVAMAVAVAGLGRLAAAADWPAFRGVAGDGRSDETRVFPDTPFGLSVKWKKELGSGYAGVSVADGYVVTAYTDGTNDNVVALSEGDGEIRWTFTMDSMYVGHDGSHDGPLSTPLIHDGKVYMLSARGKFFALDLRSGSKVWSTDVVADHGGKKPHYGFTSAPVVLDDTVILEIGAADGCVVGFDPDTGKRKWATGKDAINYQSPIPFTLFGKRQVIACGDTKLMGIEPASGKLLWEYKHGGGGPRGAWSLVPVPTGSDRFFLSCKDDASVGVRFRKDSDGVAGEQEWEDRSIRNSYNVPVYHDGHVYGYSSRFLTCVDAATGKSKWRSRKPTDGFTILVDGHLVILTKKGGVHVARATPSEYEERAGIEVFPDMAWAPPAFANGRIVAKGLKEIASVEIVRTPLAMNKPLRRRIVDSRFGQFLESLKDAPNKGAAIDAFLKRQKSFPITEGDKVHFVYRGKGKDVVVGCEVFGARQERPMTRVPGTDLFYYTATVEPDARASYIFIRDFEDHMLDPLNPRKATSLLYAKEMELAFASSGDGPLDMSWFAMPGWKAPDFLDTPDASRKGRIVAHKLDSKAEGKEISFDVYLPVGYDRSGERYEVAYVMDGNGAKEFGQWPTALDNLTGKKIRPIIVVFVNYMPPPFGPNRFGEMFAGELIPKVDETYRTMAKPEGRAVVGMGFAGNSAVMALVATPPVATRMGCSSPFVFDFTLQMVDGMLKARKGDPLTVYVDWGRYDVRNPDEAWNMAELSTRLSGMFKDAGHRVYGGQVNTGSDWPSWKNRTDALLAALFPKN